MNTYTFTLRRSYNGSAIWLQVLLLAIISFLALSGFQNSYAESCRKRNKSPTRKKETKSTRGEEKAGFAAKAARMIFEEHHAGVFGSPHTISALPILYYDFRTGLNFGFRALILSRRKNPYLYRLTLQIIASLKGSHKHKLLFEYPDIGGSPYGLMVQAEWEQDLEARYFGIGNNSINNEDLTDPESENFVDEDFYLYNLKRPRLTVYGIREILPDLSFSLGFGVENVKPQLKKSSETSFLAQDRPFGHLGGAGRSLSFRLSWDTRTNDIFPLEGFLTEFTFEPNFATVDIENEGQNGTQTSSRIVTFYRYTFSDAHFIPMYSNRLIFANRIAFEAIAGEAPYYAYGETAGQRRTRSLGGSQSLRGFQSRRFHGKIKFFTLTELRYRFRTFNLMTQSLDLILVAFFDNGRVWNRLSEVSFHDFHTTCGGGIWLNWDNNLIIRLDIGRSKEGTIAFLRLNSAF
ncbi:MAG: BamA/TamA family outer membrane protein [bacterium]